MLPIALPGLKIMPFLIGTPVVLPLKVMLSAGTLTLAATSTVIAEKLAVSDALLSVPTLPSWSVGLVPPAST